MGIRCGSQIVLCDLPVRIDTYTGCSHACKYCFVKKKVDISEIRQDNCAGALREFIAGKRKQEAAWCEWNIPLHWGGISDPFQPCEKRYRVSYDVLQVFAETGYPFIVSTKGRIIAEPEYLELLGRCNAVVQISMACSKYDKLEPGAPSYEERLQICRKVAPHCKRLIARIQPYMTDVLPDVLQNIPKLKAAGVYGVTVEGLKTQKALKGFVKVGGDYCYPAEILRQHYKKIRQACQDTGLHFFCAENRLRTMGESLCCCGCEGLPGFQPNTFNLNHVIAGETVQCTERMKQPGTAEPFKCLFQETGAVQYVKRNSLLSLMLSEKTYFSYKGVLTENPGRPAALSKSDKYDLSYMRNVVANHTDYDG